MSTLSVDEGVKEHGPILEHEAEKKARFLSHSSRMEWCFSSACWNSAQACFCI